ncbi:MAG: GGDEF domain-containing protein [Chloroflexales bacterium]|jgi:diguanylate cyclase (GGDEF)-like protein
MSGLDCLVRPRTKNQQPEHHQARLLAWMLLFIIFFSLATLVALLVFNPHHDPLIYQYAMLISGLASFFTLAYSSNRAGHYNTAAMLLVTSAIVTPWASLSFDTSILQGDFAPLTYVTLSVLLSSILLPTYITIVLAVLQIAGLVLVLFLNSATSSFNWFSFLAFVFLLSGLSILANSIIQRNIKQINAQARQLVLNEIRLRELSVRDHLTNLFNFRYLEEMLEAEIQRAIRQQHSLGIIVLDVDHFKHINDALGHAAGDTVLRELGTFLTRNIRQSDIACRYGGDEFVILLPDTSQDAIKERAEQIRDGVRNLQLPMPITISLGVATFPHDGATGEEIFKSADSALYRAKHEGRNHVMVADSSTRSMPVAHL